MSHPPNYRGAALNDKPRTLRQTHERHRQSNERGHGKFSTDIFNNTDVQPQDRLNNGQYAEIDLGCNQVKVMYNSFNTDKIRCKQTKLWPNQFRFFFKESKSG